MHRLLKRAFDLGGAFVGLLLLGPLLSLTAVLVAVTMGRPVFYGQMRAGRHGQPFRLWKFRTMTGARDASGALLPDGDRITRLGRFLRSWSVDELPQLLNVLIGNMSLVGPRPLLLRYLPRYTARQQRRHDVKPGITGWAQVRGRNSIEWGTRLELDAWYAEHASLGLDLAILALTVVSVLTRRGVKAGGTSELEEFWGTQTPPEKGPRSYPVEHDERVPNC